MTDIAPTTPKPGSKVKLASYDPGERGGMTKVDAAIEMAGLQAKLNELQNMLYADERFAVLFVLQAIDTAGKDSTINSVFQEVGPIGCQVTTFKVPTPEELAHDYLWRYRKETPEKGHIKIFNRSHYESVLVERVKEIVPEKVWNARYEDINEWERYLVRNGTIVLKFFLYISKDEQRERLQDRVDNPKKQWKFRMGDLEDRKLWDQYIAAYEDALTHCNTAEAPWHIIPANHKWYRDLMVARALVTKLESMDLRFPAADPAILGVTVE